MSQSRSHIKNFIRTGQFTKRSAEADRLSDIPEEKAIDGRPVSHVKPSVKHNSISSTVSDLSTSSTQVGTIPVDPIQARVATHSPQPGDLLFVPSDVRTPTTFGPNNEYTAVPSIVTYSASGRPGMSRVTVREATPEEAAELPMTSTPVIASPPPQYSQTPPQSASANIPTLTPPPNFQPIRTVNNSPAQSDNSHQSSQTTVSPRISHLSQGSQSIRTSTTSFRTSTSTVDDEGITEVGSNKASFTSGSPQQYGTAWSPPPASTKGSYMPTSRGVSQSHSVGSTPSSFPGTFDGTSQSRFSWHVSNTDKARNWFTRWFIEWWLMEIFSWCFSFICMLIIAIVLLKYDGKPMPEWRLGVSVNAFISIFSGFAKSALLLPTAEALGQLKWDWFMKKEKKMMDFEVLDSASRGPWGSMVMLARSKGVTLASVGAAIILLSLPLDLFFQQIISYPAQAIHDLSSNATISRAIWYDPPSESFFKEGVWTIPPNFEIDSMVFPYLLGAGGTNPGVEFNCPTGNCTYDPFYTLAADYQCKEMKDFLEFGCRNTSAEWSTAASYTGPGTSGNMTSCGWYMDIPNFRPQLMAGYEILANGTVGELLSTRAYALSDLFTNDQYFGGSVNFKDVKNPIVDYILASTPGGFDGVLKNSTPIVHECEIHWVVKQVQSRVDSGVLAEKAVKTLQFASDLASPWDADDPNLYRADFHMTLDDPHSFSEGKSTFGMDNITARKIWQVWALQVPWTENLPTGGNPLNDRTPINSVHTYGPVVKFNFLDGGHTSEMLDPSLQWDAPNNVTEQLGKQVTVLNQVLRRNTLSVRHRHDVAVGQAFKYIVLIHVRWVWITLPAALLVFSLMFLIATVMRSSKEQDKIGIWKTSALAILFNGLGEDVQDHVGSGSHKMGYQRERAKGMSVQLDDD